MLTKKQKPILDFITKYSKRYKYAPSLEEIRKRFKLASVSTAHFHIAKLKNGGYLDKIDNKARSISIANDESWIKIPLLGTIAAGEPIEAIQERETIAIPKSKVPNREVYALRVSGNSMIDENINNGDVVVVRNQSTAENGQKIVALIDQNEATLKKYYKEKGQVRLQPANPYLQPKFIHPSRLTIQGIILDVIQNNEPPVKNANVSNRIKIPLPILPPQKRKLINNLNDLTASEWIQETISVFNQKGLGAGHEDTKIERQHPAPYSFQDVGRLVRFFTKKGQRVLDPFSGVGSTLKACAVDGREGVGIELVKKYVDLTKERLQKELRDDLFCSINKNQRTIYGDSLSKIKDFEDDYFDFIVTSPPYWNILSKKADHKVKQERIANDLDTKYSNLKNDLGNIDNYDEFINILSSFFNDCSRILKHKKYLCVIVSDFRHKDKLYMFHSDLAQKLEAGNFALKGITILYQRHKKIFPYGYPYSYVPNIHHQYILIFQNKKNVKE